MTSRSRVPGGSRYLPAGLRFPTDKGLILRVSAGVDLVGGEATWLLQAIDPLTGEVIQDPHRGLLPPNDALGNGSGFVTYSILPGRDLATGTEIQSKARVLFNSAPPEDTPTLRQVIDALAPSTELTVAPLAAQGNSFRVSWQSVDDPTGGGVRHVTLYVAENGGDFRVWQRQLAGDAGVAVFDGLPNVQYEFLALATDVAGNRERPPVGVTAADDGSRTNLGSLPTVPETTPPNFGIAPEPTPDPSTNPLFVQAESGLLSPPTADRLPEFTQVRQSFEARAFVTGILQSHANIGPMAIAEAPDGSFLVSGGPGRNQLFHLPAEGGEVTAAWAELDYPVFGLEFGLDGSLWATTGGGPLLQLDPASGQVLNSYGDGLTIALAVQPSTGQLYVSSADGIEIFDPVSETFEHFSRDKNLRVGGLAFDNNGQLWATTWPDRRQVVKFNERARAETMIAFDSDIDSLAFGATGTDLDGLLFVSHNSGSSSQVAAADPTGSQLTMIDTVTLRQVALAAGGTRGDVVRTTSEGWILLSQSHQVDVLRPVSSPSIVATNPSGGDLVLLPLHEIRVTFDRGMRTADPSDPSSVMNPENYVLTHDGIPVVVQQVTYDSVHQTAILSVATSEPGGYELTILGRVASSAGVPMGQPYATTFDGLLDATELVQLDLTTTRSDRSDQTISFDLTLINQSEVDLQQPLILYLEPVAGYDGVPLGTMGQWSDGRWLIDVTPALDGATQLGAGEETGPLTVTVQNPADERVDFAYGLWTGWGEPLPQDNAVPASPVWDMATQNLLWQKRAGLLPRFIRPLPAEEADDVCDGAVTGIVNASFQVDDPGRPDFGWNLRGATEVHDGVAWLQEDAWLLSGLWQRFTLPPLAETLEFSVWIDLLGQTPGQPNDAFEIALLTPPSGPSVLPVTQGITQTDAILNVQATGATYASSGVTVNGATFTGQPVSFEQPLHVKIDLQDLAACQELLLRFDLLGFGALDSQIRIGDLLLTGGTAPVASDDQLQTDEDMSLALDVLANDHDADGNLDPASLVVLQPPGHGQLQVDPSDGTWSYLPAANFSGQDTLVYQVFDTSGLPSNEATVWIDVIPVADLPCCQLARLWESRIIPWRWRCLPGWTTWMVQSAWQSKSPRYPSGPSCRLACRRTRACIDWIPENWTNSPSHHLQVRRRRSRCRSPPWQPNRSVATRPPARRKVCRSI